MNLIRRIFTIVIGCGVVLLGIVIMPIPGPGGLPIVLAGLAILATEVPFAKKIMEKLKALKAKYFDSMSPHKRVTFILVSLFISAITTTGMFLFFRDHPEIIIEQK